MRWKGINGNAVNPEEKRRDEQVYNGAVVDRVNVHATGLAALQATTRN